MAIGYQDENERLVAVNRSGTPRFDLGRAEANNLARRIGKTAGRPAAARNFVGGTPSRS